MEEEDFRIPLEFGDLAALVGDAAPEDLRDEPVSRLHGLLDGLGVDGAEGLCDASVLGPVYALVRDFKYIPSEVKGRLLKVLMGYLDELIPELKDGATSQTARLSVRNAFKASVYLLFSAAWTAESVYSSAKQNEMLAPGGKKKKGAAAADGDDGADGGGGGKSFSWEVSRLEVLSSMARALTIHMPRIWSLGVPDEEFVSLFTRLAYKMLELPGTVRNKSVKAQVFQLIAVPYCTVASTQAMVSAGVLQLITNYEHLSSAMAELCLYVDEREGGGGARLGVDLLREISRMDMSDASSKNAAGVRNMSSFLTELAAVLPSAIFTNISILLPLFDCEPYALRSALCHCVASVLIAALVENSSFANFGETFSENDEEVLEERQQRQQHRRVVIETKTRDVLLDVLVERVHDISSYTRAAVLRAWSSLVEARAVPLDRVITVAKIGTDRVNDKSSIVRKASLQLLETLLEHNPYMGSLNPGPYESEAARVEDILRKMPAPQPSLTSAELEALQELEDEEDEGEDEGEKEAEEREEEEEEEAKELTETTFDFDKAKTPAAIATAEEGDMTEQEKERLGLIRQLNFFRSALAFISVYEDAANQMQSLLNSKTTSDVTEALGFFVVARRFELPCASSSIRKSLPLIWHSETAVQDAVLDCFVSICMKKASADAVTAAAANLQPRTIAENFIELVRRSSLAELTSLEEVLGRLTATQIIPNTVFDQLWLAVTATTDAAAADLCNATRSHALTTLAMAAKVKPSLVENPARLEALVSYGLGKRTQEARDWKTVRATSLVLQQCSAEAIAADTKSSSIVDQCLSRLVHFLQGKWCLKEDEDERGGSWEAAEKDMLEWFGAAEQAIGVVFTLSPRPELLCALCIKSLAQETVVRREESSSLALARLCFVLGHSALKLLVYTEDLASRLKKLRHAQGKSKAVAASKTPAAVDAMEAELGMTAEDEAEEEKAFAEICEQEIVGRNLLGVFGPILARIVANEGGTFDHPLLRDSAVLALCKYMCISNEVCERYLDLLFTTLERAKERSLRSNVVIALGDLAFRFPNAVEPWNHLIYARLRDEDAHVRANVLMVLTHLILNDMVKVKGLVSDIATCILDPEPRIAEMSRILFHELSNRSNNPIYNLMPDIVSRLGADTSISPPQFREIMPFLLGFIKKEKQTEGLADKLVARIAAAADDVELCRDMSYCLAQLTINEKSVKKLTETLATYKDALGDAEVFDNFQLIVKMAKKIATKPELKEAVEEWNQQLCALHQGGADELGAAARASKASKRAGRRNYKNTAPDAASPEKMGDDGDNYVSNKKEHMPPPAQRSRAKRATTKKKAAQKYSESDDEDDDDAMDVADGDDSGSGDDDPIFGKQAVSRSKTRSRKR